MGNEGNFNKDGDFDKAIENLDNNKPTILMSHDPSHWREVILNHDFNIDLQLSGHTHGISLVLKFHHLNGVQSNIGIKNGQVYIKKITNKFM